MKPASSKHFCCTICQRGFTRIDHLKRHHLRRTLFPSGVFPQSLRRNCFPPTLHHSLVLD